MHFAIFACLKKVDGLIRYMHRKGEILGIRTALWVYSLSGIALSSVLYFHGTTEKSIEAPTVQEAEKLERMSESSLPRDQRNNIPAEGGTVPAELLLALSDPDAAVRLEAVGRVSSLELNKSESIMLLIACLNDSDPGVRAVSALQLGALRMEAMDAVPTLKRLAKDDEDETVRSRAKDALYNIRFYDFSPIGKEL